MKQLLLGVLAATAISSDVLLRAVVSVNVSNASGSAASSSAAASGSNREEVEEPREPPVAPEEAGFPASQSACSVSAAPAPDSKRRRLRGKQAPSKTDEKQVGKGEPLMETCSICFEDFPASDLERYFDACGAGDICDPGHKFCSACAFELKTTLRANAMNAHCPSCNKTADRERPNHSCEVCNNEGGPRDRRDGTTRGTTGTPDEAPRVGCWGCGRLAVSSQVSQPQEYRTPERVYARYTRLLQYLANISYTPPERSLRPDGPAHAFVVSQTDMTDEERAFLSTMAQRDEDDPGEVLGAFADVVPSRLQTDPFTLSAFILLPLNDRRAANRAGPPTITFTLDDWNHLPEELRGTVELTFLAIGAGVFTDFERDTPEALQRNDHVLQIAREVGLITL